MTNRKTILLVDDEECVSAMLEIMLTQFGHDVLCASNAPDAWDILQQSERTIDILITDLVMPGAFAGRELAKRARSAQPSIGIILMSGYERDCLSGDNGLTDGEIFLRKPFSPDELAVALHRCLAEVPTDNETFAG